MRIVDPEDASSSWLVPRQRVTDPVRPTFVGRDALGHNLHPPTIADLCEKPVEVEEPQKSVVAPGHRFNISHTDNIGQAIVAGAIDGQIFAETS